MFSRTTLEQRQQQDERKVNGSMPVLTQSAAGEVHFQHADEHRRIYCALAGKRGGDLFLKDMFRQMHDLFLQELQDSSPENQKDSFGIKAAAHFYVSRLIVMLTFWLDNNL